MSTNYTPNKPLGLSTKDNIFPSSEANIVKNMNLMYEEPKYKFDLKVQDQENLHKQNLALAMNGSKKIFNDYAVNSFRMEDKYRDNYQIGSTMSQGNLKDYYMAEKTSSITEKFSKQPEKQVDNIMNKMLPPRPNSKTIMKEAINSIKDNEKQSSLTSTTTGRTSTGLNGLTYGNEIVYNSFASSYNENFGAQKRTSSVFTRNSNAENEEVTPKHSLSIQEPRGLVGLKNIGNTCFM